MREYQIYLCGLNAKYMKKLALYFQRRLKEKAEVGIWEEPPGQETFRESTENSRIVWICSEEAFTAIQKNGDSGQQGEELSAQAAVILLTADRGRCSSEENVLYMYQSCDSLYSGVFRICQKKQEEKKTPVKEKTAGVLVFIGMDTTGAVLPYAMTCAQLLGINGKSLFVNMVSCSGMRELLGMPVVSADLSDLFLALRDGSAVGLNGFTGHIGESDCIMPVENPETLDEISIKDICLFLEHIRSEDYDYVVFAMEEIRGWTRDLLKQSVHIFYLTDSGVLSACRTHEFETYLENTGYREKSMQVKAKPVVMKECGEHLIYDWLHDVPGNQVRALITQFHF